MLQSQQLLVYYRKDQAYPDKFVFNNENIELATNLLSMMKESIDKQKKEIEEIIRYTYGSKVKPKSLQAFLKILFDNSQWHNLDPKKIMQTRKAIFLQGAEYWKSSANEDLTASEHQENILNLYDLPDELKETDVSFWLYADTPSFQTLQQAPTYSAKELLNLYNIQQAQTLLFQATQIELTLYESQNGLVQLMQILKFFGLFFSIKEKTKTKITLLIEGATSILQNSRSYGIELANFFPSILLLQGRWGMKASLKIEKKNTVVYFRLTQDNIYESIYKEKNTWSYIKIQNLVQDIQNLDKKIYCKETTDIFTLKNNRYLLPDFTIGRGKQKVYFQWLRYFSSSKAKYLFERQDQTPKNYIFIIKEKKKNCLALQEQFGLQLLIIAKDLQSLTIYKHWQKYTNLVKKS